MLSLTVPNVQWRTQCEENLNVVRMARNPFDQFTRPTEPCSSHVRKAQRLIALEKSIYNGHSSKCSSC
ncbi:hypothetical protein EG68_09375 [Paragonimus skrjabini miyazakii]|uniref:Uncharacterized protein n=1 Tax=Paragonimus skrjabini miyazakii TaxID=59628 RepID=A0A8S9YHW9_9TREM|nr:hypothetical protein EG68_09375 [Paragonimus skrjabini miyazakii]